MSLSNGPGYFQYTIQPGDSLWDIADEYNVSAEEIMAANPNVDFNNLAAGQAISVAAQPQRAPSTSQPSTRPSTPERRPERGGAERGRPEFRRPGFERRPEFFRRPYYRYPYRPYPYRPYYPPYQPVQACPFGATPYVVEPGDSLYSIASRFGLSVDAVVAANPYVNFGIPLQIGQNICLPVSG